MEGEAVIIQSRHFDGQAELPVSLLKKLRVSSYGSAAKKLLQNWSGQPVFLVGCTLSVDNRHVDSAVPILQGSLFHGGRNFDARAFWRLDRQITLRIEKLELSRFTFDGCLASDLLDHTYIDYTVFEEGRDEPLSDEECGEEGICGFSLRCFLLPLDSRQLKLVTLLYPLEREVLELEQPCSEYYNFPGVTLYKEQVDLGLRRRDNDEPYGSPVLPAIWSRDPIRSKGPFPPSAEFVRAIAMIMRAVKVPECRTSVTTLMPRWAAIKQHGTSKLQLKPVKAFWPNPPVIEPPTGS